MCVVSEWAIITLHAVSSPCILISRHDHVLEKLCDDICLLLQVKIWFQNRRAKERKQMKKREELLHKEKIEAVSAAHHQLQQMAPVVAAPPASHGVVMWPDEPWFASQQQTVGNLLLWRQEHGDIGSFRRCSPQTWYMGWNGFNRRVLMNRNLRSWRVFKILLAKTEDNIQMDASFCIQVWKV